MDDVGLVRQVLGGNHEVYAELVQRWAARVLAICHARVGRADVAEELAEETLVRGFEELPSLADPSRFGPWLAGIATNTCRDWMKSRSHSQLSMSDTPVGDPPGRALDPAEDTEQAEDLGRLLRAAEALPEDSRLVLMLFYYQKATYRDIAQVLDISAATVNARLTKARGMLRTLLSCDPGPDRSP